MTLLAVLLAILSGPALALDDPSGASSAQTADDRLADAKSHMANEEWEAAAKRLREFLRAEPNATQAAEARFWLGLCLIKDQDFDAAVEALKPFEAELAGGEWADDALIQLGVAYVGLGERARAISSWKRLLHQYPDSPRRHEALSSIINLLFYETHDFAACMPYCEQAVQEDPDLARNSEARYVGAYCLNAQRRFEESDRWIDQWLDPGSGVETAWRVLLAAQRNLLRGQPELALDGIQSVGRDFPDLEPDEWLDVLIRSSFLLRQNGQAERAHRLLIGAMPRLSEHPDVEIAAVLDELAAVHDADPPEAFPDELGRLADDAALSLRIRVAMRDRQIAELRADDLSRQAAFILREAVAREPAEYPRVRATLLLADVLADDLDDVEAAVKLLDELLPSLKRPDFVHEVRSRLEEYTGKPER